MRRFATCCLFGSAVFALAVLVACKGAAPAAAPPPAAPDFRPTSPIAELMGSMVEPSADVLWNSVATVVNDKGVDTKEPKTDEEWAEVKRSAVTLVEATNLLLIDRPAAHPGERSKNPNVELQPEEIDKLRAQDPATWKMYVKGLYDAALPALNAVNKKDAMALLNSGEGIDTACENCHLHYWYPPNKAPASVPTPGKSE
jgi:hypothetical protein